MKFCDSKIDSSTYDRYIRLSKINGLDIDHGLMLARGNIVAYVRMLTLFAMTYYCDIKRFPSAHGNENLYTIRHLSHSIKETAKTIGAMKIAAAASELDILFQDDVVSDYGESLYKKMISELDIMIFEIIKAISPY